MIDSLTGEERLMLALESFNAAKMLVIHSLEKTYDDFNIKKEVFLRFYGNDFDKDIIEKIIYQLRN